MKRTQVFLPEQMLAALASISDKKGISKGEVIRRAVDDYLKNKKRWREMSNERVLENLKDLIGKEFDYDKVVCAFEDFEEEGVTGVHVGDSDNGGYDKIAYIKTKNSTQFLFKVTDDTIEDVWIA